MGCEFNKVRQLLRGKVCLSGLILMQGGCASLVFDELSDMREKPVSTTNPGDLVVGAHFGGSEDQIVYDAVVNTDGDVVIAGATLGKSKPALSCDVAGNGGLDMFVTWVDPNDMKVQCPMSRVWGGIGNDVPFGIAANPISGGVGMVGLSTGDFNCGLADSAIHGGGRDAAVAIFAGQTCSWQESFGDDKDQEGQAIAMDSKGATYIGGRFKGAINLDPPLTNSDTTGFDAFLAKLPIGVATPPWAVQAGGAGDQEVQAIAVTVDDTLVVAGRFSGSIGFDCPVISTQDAGHDALFIAAFDANGMCTQLVKIAEGPPENAPPISLAVAPDGNIFIAGGFRTRTLFGDSATCKRVNDTQEEDVFVAKLKADGECLWSRRFGDVHPMVAEHQRAYAMTVDAAANVYVTGEFYGGITFDEKHALESRGYADAFVLKLDNAGAHVWSNVIGGPGNEAGHAVVLDNADKFVFVAGVFSDGPLKLVDQSFTPVGSDVFLAKINR